MSIYLQGVIILLLVFADNTLHSTQADQEQWESAKRELARRTREYIRQNPISEQLQSFIEELRMRKPKRGKRQDHSNMYAIKDGDIVPLANLEEQLKSDSNLSENFTVVPLIIPIPLENNVTLKERQHGTEDSVDLSGTSQPAVLGRGQALQAMKSKHKEDSTESGTEETVAEDLVDDKLKSTSDSTELNKVLEDVQNLISAQKKGKGNSKEGMLCNVTGYWDSESGGMTFNINKTDTGASISMKPTEPPDEDGFIMKDKWNVSARIPFPQSAQVIITLTAHKGRRVALFLGECRICDGSETITGDWLVGRTSTNCKDQKAAHSFVADVFRKNNVETLRAAHMKKISSMTTAASTPEA